MFLENVAYEVSWNECVWKLCENIAWECWLWWLFESFLTVVVQMVSERLLTMVISKSFWEIWYNDLMQTLLRDVVWEIALKDVIWKLISTVFKQVVLNKSFSKISEKWFWEIVANNCQCKSSKNNILKSLLKNSFSKVSLKSLLENGTPIIPPSTITRIVLGGTIGCVSHKIPKSLIWKIHEVFNQLFQNGWFFDSQLTKQK